MQLNHLFLRLSVLLFVVIFSTLYSLPMGAQDFYYINYEDLQGRDCYGLITWDDEEHIFMRLKAVEGEEVVEEKDLTYHAETTKFHGMQFLMLVTEDDEDPDFAFGYGGAFEDDDVKPWVSIGDADLFEAKDFASVPMTEMDAEFLSLFYDQKEPQYQRLLTAASSTKADEQQMAQSFGDGEQIYATVIDALAQIQGRSPEDLVAADEEEGAGEGSATAATPIANAPATLHLMVVANTLIDDIGEPCRKDYEHVRGEMQQVARALNIPMKEYAVTGNRFSLQGVTTALSQLRPSANDIVVFLYSGHGFRFDDQKSRFPQMSLAKSSYEELDNNYMAMSDVFRMIENKGARLNIVMSDCCNTPIGEDTPVRTGQTLYSRSSSSLSLSCLRQLFLEQRGSILATASSPGEPSICDQSGGFYTIAFIRALRKEVSAVNSGVVSWNHVIDQAIRSAQERSERDGDGQHGLKMGKMTRK